MGLMISSIISDKEKQKKKTRKSIDDYRKIPKHPNFSKKDMPRSIRDYYKKNK